MCRITGFWFLNPNLHNSNKVLLAAMNDSLAHGGPDAAGLFWADNLQLGLAHRRLSIIDLSPTGAQPMTWGDFTVVFNGEIYNYLSIRQELQTLGHQFVGGSDTEVLLHAYGEWGLAAWSRFRGMFAFALWDERAQRLLLVRDRLGVKPLFIYQKDACILFASELKALLKYPNFDKTINPNAVNLFLRYGYVPAQSCIYQYVHKLPAGSTLIYTKNKAPKTTQYWDLADCYNNPQPIPAQYDDILYQTESLLTDSLRLRMVADVPVGAFLSGGTDSALTVALLTKKLNHNLQTFTVGFRDPSHNEAPFAAAVAKYLDTNHSELYCDENDFLTVLPALPTLYDEPFGDSSAVPTYLVSQLAATRVKVSLSADGADELFGGYTKYEATLSYFNKIKTKPVWAKQWAKTILRALPLGWLERNKRFIPILNRYNNLNYKIPKLINALSAATELDFFLQSSAYIQTQPLRELLANPESAAQSLHVPAMQLDENRRVAFLSGVDIHNYLEGDILCKVDRATMHNAIEGREPFLDHELLAFALSIPDKWKIDKHRTKPILKDLLYKYVPRELLDRPKQGFAVPIERWLRTLLLADLLAIPNDTLFCQTMGLRQQGIDTFIKNFIANKNNINPSVVWYIHCLWSWYKNYLVVSV